MDIEKEPILHLNHGNPNIHLGWREALTSPQNTGEALAQDANDVRSALHACSAVFCLY